MFSSGMFSSRVEIWRQGLVERSARSKWNRSAINFTSACVVPPQRVLAAWRRRSRPPQPRHHWPNFSSASSPGYLVSPSPAKVPPIVNGAECHPSSKIMTIEIQKPWRTLVSRYLRTYSQTLCGLRWVRVVHPPPRIDVLRPCTPTETFVPNKPARTKPPRHFFPKTKTL